MEDMIRRLRIADTRLLSAGYPLPFSPTNMRRAEAAIGNYSYDIVGEAKVGYNENRERQRRGVYGI